MSPYETENKDFNNIKKPFLNDAHLEIENRLIPSNQKEKVENKNIEMNHKAFYKFVRESTLAYYKLRLRFQEDNLLTASRRKIRAVIDKQLQNILNSPLENIQIINTEGIFKTADLQAF